MDERNVDNTYFTSWSSYCCQKISFNWNICGERKDSKYWLLPWKDRITIFWWILRLFFFNNNNKNTSRIPPQFRGVLFFLFLKGVFSKCINLYYLTLHVKKLDESYETQSHKNSKKIKCSKDIGVRDRCMFKYTFKNLL